MMDCKPWLRQVSRLSLFLLIFTSFALGRSNADVRPSTVPGELVLLTQPGTPIADVNALAANVNAVKVTPLLLADCYKLDLPDKQNQMASAAAITLLKADPRVRHIAANRIYYPHQSATKEPNDPRYVSGEQWNLKLINCPQAWALQTGAAGVTLGWIDSGYDPKHEDILGRFHPASFDVVDKDTDITADGVGGEPTHGTSTSSIAVANSNNGIGIAGICWSNVLCLALKIQSKGVASLDGTAIINSYAFMAAHKLQYNIVAVNMSYGGQGNPNDTSDPEYIGIKNCVDQGILMVASAGNSGATATPDNTQQLPSGLPFVTSVGAVGPTGKRSYYSSYGKVDIAAPGGDQSSAIKDGLLTFDQNSTYNFFQGTSGAAPHVVGVLGLMMSQPGVTSTQALAAIKSTANTTGLGLSTLPDAKYGFGLIDAYAALSKVSVSATILSPDGVDASGNSSTTSGVPPVVSTFRPGFKIQINNAPLADVSVSIDGGPLQPAAIAGSVVSGVTSGANPSYLLDIRFRFPTTAPFQHTIVVTATNPSTNVSSTATRVITLQPFSFNAGLTTLSIPYYETQADSPTGTQRTASQILGSGTTLYRYNPAYPIPFQYDVYTDDPVEIKNWTGVKFDAPLPASPLHPLADAFRPADANVPTEDASGNTTAASTGTHPLPVGLGFFARSSSVTPIYSFGDDFTANPFLLPLHEGWNLIGNPFNFSVPFNTLLVQSANGVNIPIQQAVDQKMISPVIYRYVDGDIEYHTLPDGLLTPWGAQWVYVPAKIPAHPVYSTTLTLVVPPSNAGNSNSKAAALVRKTTSITRSAAVTGIPVSTKVVGTGSWILQLSARSNNLKDTYNFVGMSANSNDGSTAGRVAKPPLMAPFVFLGISHADEPATLFAQDIRSTSGAKSWDINVATDQKNSDVTLNWGNTKLIPRNYRLMLVDKTSGTTTDLRKNSSYVFHTTAAGGTRSFTLNAVPSQLTGRALLTNFFINPSRSIGGRGSAAYEIGYTVSSDVTVDASILSSSGRVLTKLGSSRAVGVGDNHLIWNGADQSGKTLPAGAYVVRLKVMTSDGEITQETRPLLVSGR